jgi:hypothetical protein
LCIWYGRAKEVFIETTLIASFISSMSNAADKYIDAYLLGLDLFFSKIKTPPYTGWVGRVLGEQKKK